MKWAANPKVQVGLSIAIIVGSLIGWPVSALSVAKEEPQIILAISWLALIFSGYSSLVAALVDKKLDDK